MPSSISKGNGIGDDRDCNHRDNGRDNKRIKLDFLSSTEEDDDSGHNSDEDFSAGDGTGDEFNSSDFHKDLRPLTERCFGPPFHYWVHDPETTYQKMLVCVSECQKVLTHSSTTVRILLNYRNWDTGKLYDSYYESDLATVFKAAGLMDPGIPLPRIQNLILPKQCDICYSRLRPQEYFTANCGHSFCNDCWRNYLIMRVMDNIDQEKIECPAQSCKFILEDSTVMEKIDIPEAQEKYKRLITGSYIQSNRLMKWCPGPRCPGHVIELEPGPIDWRPVTCCCSHSFCFQCREPWHGPVKCVCIKKWNKKCADDSETVNWISVNTKSCPKCEVPIEKNGGCNHMSCRNTSCKHQFCWICLGDWAAHGQDNYRCNRFQENEDTNATTIAKKQHSLKRYLFYFDRYFSHHKSLKSENSLVQKMDLKIEEFKVHGVSSEFDLQFMKKGVQVLCQCRQTLMYTYVFAYYLARNNNANIFEDNQSDLQRATEELSEHLEREFICQKEAVDELRRNVMNKMNYCESRCEVLLKHVYEGYEEDGYWSYIEDEETPTGGTNAA